MPLFKRRDKKEDGEKKDKQKEEAKPEEGAEEAPEEGEAAEPAEGEETPTAEGETPEAEEVDEDDDEEGDDDDEPSIDELIEGIEASEEGSDEDPGDVGVDIDPAIGELAGEDVQLVKMAKKVVVIGDGAVGKTSLIKRFVQDVFDDRYLSTIGAKVMKKELGVNRPDTGEIVDLKLILWDIAGQETFDTVKKAYYRGASGAIVVCDATRRETMDDLHRWIENLFDVSDVIPMVIIVNKVDLEDEAKFSAEDVEREYAPYNSTVFRTSAKTGENELGKLISK